MLGVFLEDPPGGKNEESNPGYHLARHQSVQLRV